MNEKKLVERVAYNVKEAAQALGVSEHLVREMIATRQLSHIRVGITQTRILIPVSSINELLAVGA